MKNGPKRKCLPILSLPLKACLFSRISNASLLLFTALMPLVSFSEFSLVTISHTIGFILPECSQLQQLSVEFPINIKGLFFRLREDIFLTKTFLITMFIFVSSEMFLSCYLTNLSRDVRFPGNLYHSNIANIFNSQVYVIKANSLVSKIILMQ